MKHKNKGYSKNYNEFAFANFCHINDLIYNKANMCLTVEQYEHIFNYLHTEGLLNLEFIYKTRKVILYCLKYSLFAKDEWKFVQKLLEKRSDNIDAILEKYSKLDIDKYYKAIYLVIITKYINNEERIFQILNFQDYDMLLLCLNNIIDIECPEDPFGFEDKWYRDLLGAVPYELRSQVVKLLSNKQFDEFMSLLQNQKAKVFHRTNVSKKEHNYALFWEEEIREVVNTIPNATEYFSFVYKNQGLNSTNDTNDKLFRAIFNDFKNYGNWFGFCLIKKYNDILYSFQVQKLESSYCFHDKEKYIKLLSNFIQFIKEHWQYVELLTVEELYMVSHVLNLAKLENIEEAILIGDNEIFRKLERS